ncbi:phage major capsid protein [Kocuria palustris]|uniref:phage major capsid protein n=1 Tax=Kocuria palustris TaxID=71999 RepID=UPI002300F257|nr:phage major capsid protein [Kocuria palustris]
MTMLTDHAGSILPIDVADSLIITPLRNAGVALNPAVSTTITTGAHEWHAPRLDKDATAAWVAEGQEIPTSNVEISEVTVIPSKAAPLSVLSRELARDSSPDAQTIIGNSMVVDIQKVIDRAFLTNQAAPAPKSLTSLKDATGVDLELENLDSFSAAQYTAEAKGATITACLTSREHALTLANLKVSVGSNESLMQGQRVVNGVPIIIAPDLTAGTIYGVDASRIYSVIRDEVRVDVDESVYFTSDRIAVRTTMRMGFGVAGSASIIKMTATA